MEACYGASLRSVQEINDDNFLHKMPDLLVPAQSSSLETLWAAINQKDVDFNPDVSSYSSQPLHHISCGCHTWEMPNMGPILRSSATYDAQLVSVLTGEVKHLVASDQTKSCLLGYRLAMTRQSKTSCMC